VSIVKGVLGGEGVRKLDEIGSPSLGGVEGSDPADSERRSGVVERLGLFSKEDLIDRKAPPCSSVTN